MIQTFVHKLPCYVDKLYCHMSINDISRSIEEIERLVIGETFLYLIYITRPFSYALEQITAMNPWLRPQEYKVYSFTKYCSLRQVAS